MKHNLAYKMHSQFFDACFDKVGLLGDLRPGISVQTSNHPNSQSLNEISENENGLWDRDKDDDGIQYDDTVHLPWDSDAADPESPVLPTEIHGTP